MVNRIRSVDVFRAIAIMLMIAGHIFYLWTKMDYGLISGILHYTTWWGAPFFLTISGIGYYLFIKKRISNDVPTKEIFKEISKRALFLFFVTIFFLIAFGSLMGFQYTFIIYWSIFQVIAFSMIIFFFIPFLKRKISLILLCCFNFFIISTYLIIKYYEIELFYILIYNAAFPYLPWANYYVFGMILGDLLINTSIDKLKKILIIFQLTGIITIFLWVFWILPSNIDYSISLIINAYAGLFIIFPVVYYLVDIRESESFLIDSLTRWGKVSFSLYYIHFGFLITGFIIFPIIANDLYSSGFLFYQYIFLVIVVFVCIEIFLRFWEKYEFIFGIEWFMTKITKKSTVSE